MNLASCVGKGDTIISVFVPTGERFPVVGSSMVIGAGGSCELVEVEDILQQTPAPYLDGDILWFRVLRGVSYYYACDEEVLGI